MPTSVTIFPIQENRSIVLLRNFSCAQFHLSLYWNKINWTLVNAGILFKSLHTTLCDQRPEISWSTSFPWSYSLPFQNIHFQNSASSEKIGDADVKPVLSFSLNLYSPQMLTYNIQHVSIQCSFPKSGRRAGSGQFYRSDTVELCA